MMARSGAAMSPFGGATRAMMVSEEHGFRSVFVSSSERRAIPSLPMAYTTGKSACASDASRSQNRSNTSVSTSDGRAS